MSATTPEGHVTVRMYNVGFGDAFLILFPGGDRPGPRRVLVDCGSHFLGAGPRPMGEVVDQIVADVTDADGVPRIDVVVGTHRHQDHVSGFERAAWARVEVGEVWMPWTEDPADEEARQIRERQSRTAKRVRRGLLALGRPEGDPVVAIADNALTNAKAMATLHHGFAGGGRRRFLPGADGAGVVEQNLLPGVRVHALGPSRDPEVIRDMNPPDGESYLWLGLATAGAEGDPAIAPFTADWEIDVPTFEADPQYAGLEFDKGDRGRVAELADVDPFGLAVSLDKAVNGTSLVLAFEVGNAVLLFPGDAQWGTWNAMLHEPATLALLQRTTFLKIGHHGSHNATPKDFVEALAGARAEDDSPDALWAMVSTRHMEEWEEIPRVPLLQAIGELTDRVARSDEGASAPATGFTHIGDEIVDAVVPIA